MNCKITNFSDQNKGTIGLRNNESSASFPIFNLPNTSYYSIYINSNNKKEIVIQPYIPYYTEQSGVQQNLCGHLEY